MVTGKAMASSRSIGLRPIGFVQTEASNEELKHRLARSKIVVDRGLSKGLQGIGGFSHIYVLYWMHKMSESDRKVLRVHPRHRLCLPQQGVFATRSQYRPNPIGLTIAKLLRRTGNVLTVQGLDAIDGTPVLDLKPYDCWDRLDGIRVPEWWKGLEREKRRD